MAQTEFRVLSPTAILGYGFPRESFERGMEKRPDLIGVDAGSTDPGPYYLGAGKSFTSRSAVKRDLEFILAAAVERSVPCIIGTAGGCGAREHVEWTESIIREIAGQKGYTFPMAVIHADVSKETVLEAMERQRVRPLPPAPEITVEDVRHCVRIVAQMGAEPVLRALDTDCRVILCGRCYDPIPFAAPAVRAGFDPGLAVHMGKVLECAAIAATPGSGCDCVMGTLYRDGFELESLNPQRRFTRVSTAAHTLYEKSDPYHLPGPGGTLDLEATRFEALDGGRVRVSGTRFVPADPYTVKLEGVKRTGYRSICIAGIRDPILVGRIDTVLEAVKEEVRKDLDFTGPLLFHQYGKNGVMGAMEPEKDRGSHELGLVMEVIAPDQEQANAVCSYLRSTLLHFGYPGRISTAGNLALLYSPSDIACGEVYEFSLYHLMEVDDPESLFPICVREVKP
ncbi:MAG TPA: acyclic terpene utilization AtuA family protein [Syntrophobacteraceae bacterium]|nr:acyclic terpene utilization AtuA family protein [Syntrophobacteraceae bacterium]